MGRKDKRYAKDLHQQAYDRLVSMQAFGQPKSQDKKDGSTDGHIYSYSTYQTYKKHIGYFLKWLTEAHPEVALLKKAKPYVNEYLQMRSEQKGADGKPLSAWTLHLETCALGKLFGISGDDPGRFRPPVRHREDIKRSRDSTGYDKHFSVTNNAELIRFCRGTGLRRAGLLSIKGKDLFTREQVIGEVERILKIPEGNRHPGENQWLAICMDALAFDDKEQRYFVRATEKGGRMRLAPIIGPDTVEIVGRFQRTAPEQNVWLYVHKAADIHGYRADYARALYLSYARPIEKIPYDRVNRGSGLPYQSQVYVCRNDESRKKLDRKAALVVSKALGHNRVDTAITNYIRGI